MYNFIISNEEYGSLDYSTIGDVIDSLISDNTLDGLKVGEEFIFYFDDDYADKYKMFIKKLTKVDIKIILKVA